MHGKLIRFNITCLPGQDGLPTTMRVLQRDPFTRALFDDGASAIDGTGAEPIADGAVVLRGFAATEARALVDWAGAVDGGSPWRHMSTPGGQAMSAAITNAGTVGWLSDRSGYRYAEVDPLTGLRWPDLPEWVSALAGGAAEAAGYPAFVPDTCLLTRYLPGTRLSLHQDRNEPDLAQPVVSISLGLPATFLFGGLQRSDRARRLLLTSGDATVWGGVSRLAFHGIAPLAEGSHALTGRCRINLSFRVARRPGRA